MTINLDNSIRFLILIIFLTAFAKSISAFFIGVDHSAFTLVNFISLIVFGFLVIALFIQRVKIDVPVLSLIFIVYHAVLYFIHATVDIFIGDHFGLISSTFAFFRNFSIFALFIIISLGRASSNEFLLIKLITLLAVFTTIVSLLQHPVNPYNYVINARLGDIVSANHLGLFRTTGGLGGTVVDYSFYLVVTAIFLYAAKLPQIGTLLFALLLSGGIILSFSRSSIIVAIILLFAYIFKHHKVLRGVLVFIFLCSFAVFGQNYFSTLVGDIFTLFKVASGDSDVMRVEGWMRMIDRMNLFSLIFGTDVGGNTGLYLDNRQKFAGDGYLISHIFDFGLFGTMLLMSLIFKSIQIAGLSRFDHYLVFFVLVFTLTINSGFEKVFNFSYLFICLYCLKIRDRRLNLG